MIHVPGPAGAGEDGILIMFNKNRRLIRAVSLAVSSALLLFGLSCSAGPGGGSGDRETETSYDTTSREYGIPEALEGLRYGGEKFTVLCRSGGMVGDDDLFCDELVNRPVEEAVYHRTQTVCSTLGVEIVPVRMEEGDMLAEIELAVSSGSNAYDLVECCEWKAVPLIARGYMYDLVSESGPYFDTVSPWWSRLWIREATMGNGSLYFITGAPALSLYRLIFVMFYNKDLGKDLRTEDLYSVVEEGRWTLDFLAELVSPLYRDMNGNDRRDTDDSFGLVMNDETATDPFWSSCDITLFTRGEDGWYEYSDSDKMKVSSVFDRLYDLVHANKGTWSPSYGDQYAKTEEVFASGNALLANTHLRYAEFEKFRNMQDEYGIIPLPKYDETQKDYYSFVHDQYSVFFIPVTARDRAMSGAVLEDLGYESYSTVLPVYYDLVLKGRYASDPQTRRMIDLITENVRMDPGWIYGNVLGEPCQQLIRFPVHDGVKSFASNLVKVSRDLPDYLEKFSTEIEALEH